MLCALLLLAVPPSSVGFAVLYLLCGVSDVLDGAAARALHTESEAGARLDSLADLLFAAVYAVRIAPMLHLPLWVWVWVAGIAAVKSAGILLASKRAGKLSVRHSLLNRLTGLTVYLLPLTLFAFEAAYPAAAACALASAAAIEEIAEIEKNGGNKDDI